MQGLIDAALGEVAAHGTGDLLRDRQLHAHIRTLAGQQRAAGETAERNAHGHAFVRQRVGHVAHNVAGKCHFCMAGYVLDNTLSKSGYVSRGECSVDASGYLTGITERTKICEEGDSVKYLDGEEWKPIPRDTTVSMNFFGFTPEILTYIRDGFLRFVHDPTTDLAKAEYYLPHAVTQMLRDGLCDIRVLNTTAKWFGVTYPDDKPMVAEEIDKMISSGIYPDGLWK